MPAKTSDVETVSKVIDAEVPRIAKAVYERGFATPGPDAVKLKRDEMIDLFQKNWSDQKWRIQELERWAPEGPAGRPEAGLDAFFTMARAAFPEGYVPETMGAEAGATAPSPMPSDRGEVAGLIDHGADDHLPTAPAAADHIAAAVGGEGAPAPGGMAPPTAGPAASGGNAAPAPAGLG